MTEHTKFKSLPSLIFILLACLISIRPFFSGLTYPVFEFYYETAVISLAIITLFLSLREVYLKHNQDIHAENGAHPGLSHGFLGRNTERPLPICGLKAAVLWPRMYSYAIPILLLSLAYMLSTITSINIQNSLKETIKFISYISIFFVVSHAGDKQKKNLVKIIVICASIISIYCIYQYIWGYRHTLDYFEKINSNFISVSSYARDILIDKRALGTFPSPNILGSYLLITLFLSLVILENTKARQKWLLAPFLMLIALALTKSLGAWLSLIGAITILFFISYNKIKKRKLILTSFIICIISVLVFIILNRWDRLINLESSYNSITQRLNYWQTAIVVIKDHPVFGIGPGNFQEVFLKYKIGLSTNTRYAHNIFLQLWAETGILGLLGMISLIVVVVTKNTVKSKYLFLAGLSFLFHNLIDLTYFIPEAGLFWWIVISLAK